MNRIFPYLKEIYVLGPRKNKSGTSGQFIWHDVLDPGVVARNDDIIRRAYIDIITVRNQETLLQEFRAIAPDGTARANR